MIRSSGGGDPTIQPKTAGSLSAADGAPADVLGELIDDHSTAIVE
jgi:hypothetical protein